MKIALLISSLHLGGAQRVASVVANYWSEHGHEVTIYTLSGSGEQPFYDLDPSVGHVPMNASRLSRTYLSGLVNNVQRIRVIRSELRRNRPDVLMSFMDTTNVLAVLAARLVGVPVVVSERMNPATQEISAVWRRLRDWSYGEANVVVAQTERARASFSPVVQAHCKVIPNPVLVSCAAGTPAEIVLPKPNVLAMGRLVTQKGFNLLIEAFSRLAQRHSQWTLVIVGEGPERGKLQDLTLEFGIQDRVVLPGHTTKSGSVLRQGDIFAMTSRMEGFPNALCEAMAHGLPVVSFDCPFGPAEIIRDGVDGILVPHLDLDSFTAALDSLMSSEDKRCRLAERAPEVVDRFGLEAVMGMWEDVLRLAVRQPRLVRSNEC